MEIVTTGQTLQDNTIIYELEKDGEHILFGETRGITEYLGAGKSSLSEIVKRGKTLHGHHITPIGRFEYYFEKDGVVGSKRTLRKEFGLSPNTKFYASIGGFFNGESVQEITVETFKERQEKERRKLALYLQSLRPKNEYKGENKAYMDSLFKSAVGGWK